MLAAAPIDPRATVLDVMCGTGAVAVPLLERLEPRGRVVALDPSNPLLDVARRKAGPHLGKRLFFRHERLERLSFADEVFDLVVSNAGVLELPDPSRALAESVRVTKPGGALAMTLCLRGTFQEALDLLREVIERADRGDLSARLDEHIKSYPSDNEAIARFEGLGLREVSLVRSSFPVEFSSGRAFLASALVTHRFLAPWTTTLGKENAPLLLGELATTIDTYFGLDPFEVTVQAACLVGRKAEHAVLEASAEVVAEKAAAAPAAEERGAPDDADRVTPVRSFPIPPEASGVREAPEEEVADATPLTDEAAAPPAEQPAPPPKKGPPPLPAEAVAAAKEPSAEGAADADAEEKPHRKGKRERKS